MQGEKDEIMKKMVLAIVSMMMLLSVSISSIAATSNVVEEDTIAMSKALEEIEKDTNLAKQAETKASITYWKQINTTMSSNYHDAFSVAPKGSYPTKRKVYLSGGVVFGDKVARNINVTVGSKTFSFLGDGSGQTRGSVEVSTEIPVIIRIEGLSGNPVAGVVLNVYSLD